MKPLLPSAIHRHGRPRQRVKSGEIMHLIFEWQEPTIEPSLRAGVEVRVAAALGATVSSNPGRGALVINFVPDLPANSALVATIVEARTGRLLGTIESSADRESIDVIPLDPG